MNEYAYVVNVQGVVVRDGEYLLAERSADEEHAAGLLGFPGGRVEQAPGGDDTIERTAARELAEEVGLDAGTVEYVLSTTFEDDTGTPCLNVLTHCAEVDGEARPRDPGEVAAVHWLSRAELRDREDVPAFTERYADAVAAHRGDRAD